MTRRTACKTVAGGILVLPPALVAGHKGTLELRELLEKSYLELLSLASKVDFLSSDYGRVRELLAKERKSEQERLRHAEEGVRQESRDARRKLDELNRRASEDTEEMAAARRDLHCRILRLERKANRLRTEREQGVPIAFENRIAKLELLSLWPARQAEIREQVRSGRARERRYGDVEDIGVRKVGEGQEKDIKLGEDAIREMKAYGLFPPELEHPEVKAYVQRIAKLIASHSDVTVPVRVTILDSTEINAFALPGGHLYVNTGLLEKADNESELAGVIAHELAHVAARHGARLMKRATIASIVYQAAQVAAIIFTGGAVALGTYYALQYGFFGLGMVINLTLLGISRDFEAEADQLGVQYSWNAGYDPRGFITFFDRMASEKGYVRSTSFFRTHPPAFDRILDSFREIEFLPPSDQLCVDCSEFSKVKEQLRQSRKERERQQGPALRRIPQCGDEEEEDTLS